MEGKMAKKIIFWFMAVIKWRKQKIRTMCVEVDCELSIQDTVQNRPWHLMACADAMCRENCANEHPLPLAAMITRNRDKQKHFKF